MPDLVSGGNVYGRDTPPSQWDQDWSTITNVTSTTFIVGSPEVGVNFTAPTSGRVLICVGAGIQNNAATLEQGAVAYALFEESSDGPAIVNADSRNGVQSQAVAVSGQMRYMGGYSMEEDLTPGKNYYAQLRHRCILGNGTVDIASRDIAVIPLP